MIITPCCSHPELPCWWLKDEDFQMKLRGKTDHFLLNCSILFGMLSQYRSLWSTQNFISPTLRLFLCPQPALIAWSPWPFLRSARSYSWPWWPAVVYFNSSGETDSREPPHPSPPGQGCLHGQTLHRGRRGRSRITVTAAGAWTFITGRLVCLLLVSL